MDVLIRECRFALRLIRQSPVVSGVTILSLAMGIGASLTMFSLVNALLLKPLPVDQPHELVQVGQMEDGAPRTSFSYAEWEALRPQQGSFAGLLAIGNAQFDLTTSVEKKPVRGIYVSGAFFDLLGVHPIVGRQLLEADDRVGGGPDGPVAVISYVLWQREFGGQPSVVGRTLHLDGHPFSIVGVAPRSFFGIEVGRAFDVAIPLGAEPLIRRGDSLLHRRSVSWLRILGRLESGHTESQAGAQLATFRSALRAASVPEEWSPQEQATYLSRPFFVQPAGPGLSALRTSYFQPLVVLLATVALVLLIACANIANLLLARSGDRQRELAVRLSLGASRAQLARQLLVESLLLSFIGTVGGGFLAIWGSPALVQLLSTRNNVVSLDLTLDGRMFLFACAIGTLTGLLFGMVPALRVASTAPITALKDASRGLVRSGGRLGPAQGLVVLQVAVSFLLVLCATLFMRTFVSLTSQDMGFVRDGVLIVGIDLKQTALDAQGRTRLLEQIQESVTTVAGVEAISVSAMTPIGAGTSGSYPIDVAGYDGPSSESKAYYNRITPDYFKVFGTALRGGRAFTSLDRAGTARVMIVNEAFARKFFRGENPIDRYFAVKTGNGSMRVQIVGLVADSKYQSLRDVSAPPTMYQPWSQAETSGSLARLSLRLSGPPHALQDAVLRAIEQTSKDVRVDFRSFQEDLSTAVIRERLVALLSAFFGGLALLLAAIGIYGVISYSVTRRRNEIGIRVALGAVPGRILTDVLRQAAMITAAGMLFGAVVAIGLGRYVNALLYNVAATEPSMFLISGGILGIVAALAGYIPARRAASVDPMEAIREP